MSWKKAEVLAEYETRTKSGLDPEPFLKRKAGQTFFNTSPMDLKKLLSDPDHIAANLLSYIQGFSAEVRGGAGTAGSNKTGR